MDLGRTWSVSDLEINNELYFFNIIITKFYNTKVYKELCKVLLNYFMFFFYVNI